VLTGSERGQPELAPRRCESKGRTHSAFQTIVGRTKKLTGNAMDRVDVYKMMRRRALEAGIKENISRTRFGRQGSPCVWRMVTRWNTHSKVFTHDEAL